MYLHDTKTANTEKSKNHIQKKKYFKTNDEGVAAQSQNKKERKCQPGALRPLRKRNETYHICNCSVVFSLSRQLKAGALCVALWRTQLMTYSDEF